MLMQAAAPAFGAPPDQGRLGWLILVPLLCLALLQGLMAWTGALPVHGGKFADPDSYMRLTRVLALDQGGAWFDARESRINPPDGHLQHWTRPVDGLLLAGAWVLQPWLGLRAGLELWAMLFSPVCLGLTLLVVAWAAKPLLGRDERMIACFTLLLQPSILAYCSLGRADHHALLLLLCAGFVGLVLRLAQRARRPAQAIAAGLLAALSLWLSTESLVMIALGLGTLGLLWLQGRDQLQAPLQQLLSALALGLAVALVIERGPAALAATDNDRLSLVHVALFGLLAGGWLVTGRVLVAWQGRRFGPLPWLARLLVAGSALALVAGLMLWLFPSLQQGVLGQVDPTYDRLRLQRILEIQPVLALAELDVAHLGEGLHRFVLLLGISCVALPYLAWAWRCLDPAGRRAWLVILAGSLAYGALACYQVRWAAYAELFLSIPYAAAIGTGLRLLAARLRPETMPLVRAPAIVVALLWWAPLAQALPSPAIETAIDRCPIGAIAGQLAALGEGRPRTIMALADHGPELLYRTPHNVLSIPNHRPQPGFVATHGVLTATSDPDARAMLEQHQVDWLLLCPGRVEASFARPAQAGQSTFRERLLTGQLPLWLRPLSLTTPPDADIRLFARVSPLEGTP